MRRLALTLSVVCDSRRVTKINRRSSDPGPSQSHSCHNTLDAYCSCILSTKSCLFFDSFCAIDCINIRPGQSCRCQYATDSRSFSISSLISSGFLSFNLACRLDKSSNLCTRISESVESSGVGQVCRYTSRRFESLRITTE